MRSRLTAALAVIALFAARSTRAQTFRSDDPVIRAMWSEGMERSQVERLAQVLMDSIGPRLSGTQGFTSAVEWLVATYGSWGVPARREQYGTWRSWRQGPAHVDLIAPRVRTLDARLLAWSAGTQGRAVEGEVVVLPRVADEAEAAAFLRTLRGKFVLISMPEPTCRPTQELERLARPATVERIQARRRELAADWAARTRAFGGAVQLQQRLEDSGAAGLLTLFWSGGWGVNKVMSTAAERVPAFDLSCEDYGLLYRLATNRQGPRIRVTAEAQGGAESPMFNVIAELRGSELPDEYVVLSAHLDSWHSASGATDNGTGTIMMLEAMRILRATYPHPRRTIIVGHWGGEEQGLNGSNAFLTDHPEVVAGLQAAFNQDNGTWRIEHLQAQGFSRAGANLARWISQIPAELTEGIRLDFPGQQENPGSDHSSFICRGIPGFRLQSHYAEYRQYTWHTNLDTFDKVVLDDLMNNATLVAMLAYAASEDRERVPRDRALLIGPGGQPRAWPTCGPVRRR